MTTYVNPFTGQTISPSQVAYESLSISTNTTLQWPVNGTTSSVASNIIEVTATVGSLNLIMPSAQQVSVGQALIISNVGAITFFVVNNANGAITTVPAGIIKYIYVTSNSTDAGTWSAITFGAGTSSADAASLAGNGLLAIGSTLNQSYPASLFYSSTTLTTSNRSQFIVYEGGAGTITLPSASSVGNNWFCMIRNNGTGILNILPVGTDTIDNNVSTQLQLTESFVIVSNGSNWNTFGYGQSIQFAFTQLALNVTGGTTTLTSSQASNVIQAYSGTLTSNQIIILPPTVQLYTLTNNTTGAFTLTFKTVSVGATTVVINQGDSLVVICDGTNVYNAASGASSNITSLTLGNGSLGSPSLKFSGDVTTGIYLPSAGKFAVVAGGVLAGVFTNQGLSGGAF
jgi:hypothetical protein